MTRKPSMVTRRTFLESSAAAVVSSAVLPAPATAREAPMYGLISRLDVVPGKRDVLTTILLDGTANMPGCLSYVVANDPGAADAIWITEVWESQEHHQASLSLPAVQQALAQGRPMITAISERTVTRPVGGFGLGAA